MKAKHAALVCLLFTSVAPGQTTNCVAPPIGLVSWWRAETNTLDSWGTNHGTASAKFQPGKVGTGFTAASSTKATNSASLQITNELTIEAWVNPGSNVFQYFRAIVSKFDFSQFTTSQQCSYFLGTAAVGNYPNTPIFMLSPSGSSQTAVAVAPVFSNLPAGQWSHLAGTYDGSVMRLYLNGTLIAQTNYSGGIFRGSADLGIGAVPLSTRTYYPFNGLIDEVSIYRRALPAGEIAAIHAAGSAGKCGDGSSSCTPGGLVSWWRGEGNPLDNWGLNDARIPVTMRYETGHVGQAFSLSYFNIATVPDSPSLRLTNALTIEGWVSLSSQTVTGMYPRTIVSKFANPYDTTRRDSSFLLGTTTNRQLYFAISSNGSAQVTTSLVSTGALTANQWAHVAATYDGAALRLYLNGVPQAERTYTAGIFPGTADLGFSTAGTWPRSTWPMIGLVDELSIYNRALARFEVQSLWAAGAAGKCLVGPTITGQPESQAIPAGEDVKFAVSVFGSRPLRHQWRFNGQNVTGATNATLILEKVQSNRIGNYSVFVSNSVGTALSSGAALTLLPAPGCTQTLAGQISWWPGDGNGSDAVGANNASFLTSAYVTGKVDRAFSFLGNASYRATVLNSPSLNFGSNADFSIEMWIKAGASNSTFANVPLLEKRSIPFDILPIPTSWVGYSLSLNQGRLALALGSTTGRVSVVSSYISPGPDLRDAMFHHVAVCVNRGATNGGSLYVDGQPVLTFDPTPRNGNLTTTSPLYIGGPTSTVSNSYFGGLIDEPAIYGRALSAAEILDIRNAGAAGRCKVRPSIITQPVSQRVTVGSNVTFSVGAEGSPKLRYQWLRNGSIVTGATNSTYSVVVTGNGGSYSVRVTNLFGMVISSNAVLTVNFVPTAMTRSVTTLEDAPTNILVSAFDSNFADRLTFTIVTPPQHGTLGPLISMPGGASVFAQTTYTPAPGYSGNDGFTFKVNDGLVDSGPGTVSIKILPVNDAPVVQSQSVSLNEDTLAAITLGAFDEDGDVLAFSVGAPAHGTLSGPPPNLMYLPATNYFGPDSFTFRVNDGQTNSNVATMNLTVRPVNDAPFANIMVSPLLTNLPGVTNWVAVAAVCDNASVALDGSGSSDVERDVLTYVWLAGTNELATGMLTTNYLSPGSHEISLQVNDGQTVGTASATVEVISPAQGVGILIVLLHESDLGRRNAQPLIASLKNAAAAFDRCESKPGANQLEAFKHKVKVQIAPSNPELAARLIEAVEQVLGAVR